MEIITLIISPKRQRRHSDIKYQRKNYRLSENINFTKTPEFKIHDMNIKNKKSFLKGGNTRRYKNNSTNSGHSTEPA